MFKLNVCVYYIVFLSERAKSAVCLHFDFRQNTNTVMFQSVFAFAKSAKLLKQLSNNWRLGPRPASRWIRSVVRCKNLNKVRNQSTLLMISRLFIDALYNAMVVSVDLRVNVVVFRLVIYTVDRDR